MVESSVLKCPKCDRHPKVVVQELGDFEMRKCCDIVSGLYLSPDCANESWNGAVRAFNEKQSSPAIKCHFKIGHWYEFTSGEQPFPSRKFTKSDSYKCVAKYGKSAIVLLDDYKRETKISADVFYTYFLNKSAIDKPLSMKPEYGTW